MGDGDMFLQQNSFTTFDDVAREENAVGLSPIDHEFTVLERNLDGLWEMIDSLRVKLEPIRKTSEPNAIATPDEKAGTDLSSTMVKRLREDSQSVSRMIKMMHRLMEELDV